MAAGAWTLTNTARTKLLNGTFDLDTDLFKVALFLSTSNLTVASTTFAGVDNEHGTTNTGYTAGGEPAAGGTVLELTGTTTVKVTESTPWVWTAGSAGITAKWAALYEVGGDVLCFCLLESGGANVSVTEGNTLTITAHASGIFTLA
jgi:hypothetical protein